MHEVCGRHSRAPVSLSKGLCEALSHQPVHQGPVVGVEQRRAARASSHVVGEDVLADQIDRGLSGRFTRVIITITIIIIIIRSSSSSRSGNKNGGSTGRINGNYREERPLNTQAWTVFPSSLWDIHFPRNSFQC